MNQEQCVNCIYHWRCKADHEKSCRLNEHMRDTFGKNRIIDVGVRTDIIDISRKTPTNAAKNQDTINYEV